MIDKLQRVFLSKRFGWVLLAAFVVNLAILGVWWLGEHDTVSGPISRDNVTLLTPSVPVSSGLSQQVITALQRDRIDAASVYAITNVHKRGPYTTVSLAAFPADVTDPWNLEQAHFMGSIMLVAGTDASILVPGGISDQPAQPAAAQLENNGVGGAGDILPVNKGTSANYGMLGVHDCGFGLTGFKAIDLFPSDRGVYAAKGGTVDYVCRDSVQMSIKIGNYVYAHLIDNGLQPGTEVSQGQFLGTVKTGSFNATCGNASQNAGVGHVHFCFAPDNGGNTYQTDCYNSDPNSPYTLNLTTSEFTIPPAGTITTTGSITANWCGTVDDVKPPAGLVSGNIWDNIVQGETELVKAAVPAFPLHTPIGLAQRVLGIATVPLSLIYAVILVNFNMTITMWVFGIITALETVRRLYAVYMWIKRAIPIIG